MEKMKLQIQKFAITVTTTFQESNTNIEANTSTLKVNIYFSPNNTQTWFQSATLYCWVDGAEQSQKVGLSKGGSVSASFTYNNIQHNNDGTKTVSWEWYIRTGTSVLGTLNPTGTRTLTTIPRASQPTIDDTTPELGQQITITTNRVSDTFTHTLRYQFGNATGTIATNVTQTATWTPAITLAQQIPNAESGTGTIYCDTYSGTTLIGTKSVNFTASVPANITPSISLSNPTIGGSAPAGWGIFVKGKSTASYTITGTGNQGSTITEYYSTISGYTYTTAQVTTGLLLTPGTNTITARVKDSRNRTAQTTKNITVIDYYNPSFVTVEIHRYDANGNQDDNGEYLYYHFTGSVSSCSGNNKGTFKIGYRVKNTGNYTYITIASNQESIDISRYLTANGTASGQKIQFLNTQTYDIIFTITDAFITTENLQELDTGFDLMNFNPSGQAMAIGKVSEAGANERKLEIAMDTQIEGDVETIGDININSQYPALSLKDNIALYATDGLYMGGQGNYIVLRPSGIQSATGQVVLYPAGNINANGNITTTGGYITTGNDTGYTCDNQNATSPRKGKYTASGTGRLGIYDNTNGAWVIMSEPNQTVKIPHDLYVNNVKVTAGLVAEASAKNVGVITLTGLDLARDKQYEIWVTFNCSTSCAIKMMPNGKDNVAQQYIQDCRVNGTNHDTYNRNTTNNYLYAGDVTYSGQSTLLVYRVSVAMLDQTPWHTVNYQMSNVGGTASSNTTTWGGGQFKIADNYENITSWGIKPTGGQFTNVYVRIYKL